MNDAASQLRSRRGPRPQSACAFELSDSRARTLRIAERPDPHWRRLQPTAAPVLSVPSLTAPLLCCRAVIGSDRST